MIPSVITVRGRVLVQGVGGGICKFNVSFAFINVKTFIYPNQGCITAWTLKDG